MKHLTTLLLTLLVLGGCSESSLEEFTIFCEDVTTDNYFSFKSDEVIYKSVLNEVGLATNSMADYSILKVQEKNEILPITELSEGYIKFGNPPTKYGHTSYVLNRVTLSLRTSVSMFRDGKLYEVPEVAGISIDNPIVASNECIKLQN